jgi:hypothetical protein
MMQELGVAPQVIDRCQNHVMEGSRVRRHYQHYEYAAKKREAWLGLGERLDLILNSGHDMPPIRTRGVARTKR